jgi:HSP20 family protein
MTLHKNVAIVPRGNMLPAMVNGQHENHILPSTDIVETPDAFVLMMDMPGVARESIKVVSEQDTLTVAAHGSVQEGNGTSLLRTELHAPSYRRVFNLGEGINRSTIDALFEDGVLTIKLFKNEEMKPREIQIH